MKHVPSSVHVGVDALPDLPSLERTWRGLEARAEASFFLSWPWIGCWLESLPRTIAPRLLHAQADGETVGLGVLVRQDERRYGVLPSRRYFLNATGDEALDDLTIEYNGFLVDRRIGDAVRRACIGFVLASPVLDCEELHLDAVRDSERVDEAAAPGARAIVRRRRACHGVDLAALRASGRPYIETLGASHRSHIRRSLREYGTRGEVTLDEARTPEEALHYLAELVRLHQAYWESRRGPGSFASPFFRGFHERLVRTRFGEGAVQLLRVRAGAAVVGYLYNFVHRGHVYYYQSGLDYGLLDKHNRPGLVAHLHAVEHNVAKGHRIYDFMAGGDAYKGAMGTPTEELVWQVVRRDKLKYRVEDGLRGIASRIRRRAGAS